MGSSLNFAKYKVVKATPPPEVLTSAGEPSPLQERVREAYDGKEWVSFQNVPHVPVVDVPKRGKTPAHKISEAEALENELKRAARQLGYGVSIRRVNIDGKPDHQHVFFLVGERRKYRPRDAGVHGANGSAGGQQTIEQATSGETVGAE